MARERRGPEPLRPRPEAGHVGPAPRRATSLQGVPGIVKGLVKQRTANIHDAATLVVERFCGQNRLPAMLAGVMAHTVQRTIATVLAVLGRQRGSGSLTYKLSRAVQLKGELQEVLLCSGEPHQNYAASVAMIGLRYQR
jgi:hypothetical protein